MTPPEWLGAAIVILVLAWTGASAVARLARPYVDLRVGRHAIELARETGWWEGTRHGVRVRVDLRVLDEDGVEQVRWTVTRHQGQRVAVAANLTDAQAELLVAEWYGG